MSGNLQMVEQINVCMNMDDILRSIISNIWEKYDQDKNGFLDRDECQRFILDVINELHGNELKRNERVEDAFC